MVGFNGDNRIDVVECLDGKGTTEWRLAPLLTASNRNEICIILILETADILGL